MRIDKLMTQVQTILHRGSTMILERFETAINVNISASEERELLTASQAGDDYAREDLIIGHQWLVKKTANEYKTRGVDFEDLVQAGNIGLIEAIDNFDLSKQVRLSTYAGGRIRDEILKECRNYHRAIPLPDYQLYYAEAVSAIESRLTDELGYSPSNAEMKRDNEFIKIVKQSGCAVETIINLRFLNQGVTSLDQSVENDDGLDVQTKVGDFVVDERNDFVKEIERKDYIDTILQTCLSTDEERVFRLYVVDDLTFKEIGKQMGLQGQRVRLIWKSANKKIADFKVNHPDMVEMAVTLY